MAGEKAEVIPTAETLASRLAALRPRKRSMLRSVRLKAWASRMPPISSCRSALTSPTVCARLAVGPAGARGEEPGREQHHRDDREAGQRQRDVESEHRRENTEQAEDRAEQLRQALGEKLAERVDVAEEPAHQIADGPSVEVRQRQALQVIEEPGAQRRRARADPRRPPAASAPVAPTRRSRRPAAARSCASSSPRASLWPMSTSMARPTSQGPGACAIAIKPMKHGGHATGSPGRAASSPTRRRATALRRAARSTSSWASASMPPGRLKRPPSAQGPAAASRGCRCRGGCWRAAPRAYPGRRSCPRRAPRSDPRRERC